MASVNDPIIVADAGPLIRLAAAGLLDSMRLTNRRIVMVDRVEDATSALVLYEDSAVPALMAAATVPMTLMSTRAFVRLIAERGHNRDAVKALEHVSSQFNLKPPISTVVEPNTVQDDD